MTRILVVDDEQAICEMLQELLTDEGYAVTTVSNGREALARVGDEHPDLVLTDVMMPIMDGAQLCRALAADPQAAAIPVVLMSAAGERNIRTRCNYAAFVDKPFNLLDLLDTVERVLNGVAGR